MKYLLLALALVFSLSVRADIENGRPIFNWQQPTFWTDGTPLTAAQITGYQLVCTGPQAINARIATAAGVPPSGYPPASSPPLPPGAYACTLAVWARETATATETLGVATAPANFTVPQRRATAPAALSVD